MPLQDVQVYNDIRDVKIRFETLSRDLENFGLAVHKYLGDFMRNTKNLSLCRLEDGIKLEVVCTHPPQQAELPTEEMLYIVWNNPWFDQAKYFTTINSVSAIEGAIGPAGQNRKKYLVVGPRRSHLQIHVSLVANMPYIMIFSYPLLTLVRL